MAKVTTKGSTGSVADAKAAVAGMEGKKPLVSVVVKSGPKAQEQPTAAPQTVQATQPPAAQPEGTSKPKRKREKLAPRERVATRIGRSATRLDRLAAKIKAWPESVRSLVVLAANTLRQAREAVMALPDDGYKPERSGGNGHARSETLMVPGCKVQVRAKYQKDVEGVFDAGAVLTVAEVRGNLLGFSMANGQRIFIQRRALMLAQSEATTQPSATQAQ